jgi:hypothetical protein
VSHAIPQSKNYFDILDDGDSGDEKAAPAVMTKKKAAPTAGEKKKAPTVGEKAKEAYV